MKTKIVYNGKEYSSLDELPPEAREAFERAGSALTDKNRDGVPDILEGRPGEMNVSVTTLSQHDRKIVFNGREYSSPDELPPEARAAYRQAMEQLDKDADGVPDLVQETFKLKTASPERRASLTFPTTSSVTSDEAAASSRRWIILLAGAVIILLGVALVLLFLLFAGG